MLSLQCDVQLFVLDNALKTNWWDLHFNKGTKCQKLSASSFSKILYKDEDRNTFWERRHTEGTKNMGSNWEGVNAVKDRDGEA